MEGGQTRRRVSSRLVDASVPVRGRRARGIGNIRVRSCHSDRLSCAIVGAGFAGLATCWHLLEKAHTSQTRISITLVSLYADAVFR